MPAGPVPNPPWGSGSWSATVWESTVWGGAGIALPPPPPPAVAVGVGDWFTSAGLLARLKRELKRPTADAAVDDADLYQLLTEGFQWVQALLATHGLDLNSHWEEALTTDGLTFKLLDEPVGRFEVRSGRTGARLRIGADTDPMTDLIWHGRTFTSPDNRVRTYGNGVWVHHTIEHGPVDATHEPTLRPTRARLAAVYKAAELWLDRGGYKDNEWVKVKMRSLLFGDDVMPGSGIIPSQKQPFSTTGQGRGQAWWVGNPDFINASGGGS